MALPELWAVELLLAAFAGGVFGAAIGALPSFTITGLLVVLGETAVVVQRALGPDASLPDITGTLAFGAAFGPHVAFGGGAAALAYAARRGYTDGDGDPFDPKEITEGLGSRWDVLLVGGAFGVLGHWLATFSGSVGLPWDPVAFGVVASALLHRAVFGYRVVGDWAWLPGGRERHASDGGRPVADHWLPYQRAVPDVAVLGVAVGILGAAVAYETASAFLAFGVSVVSLLYINAGTARIPVTHHITLPASTAVVAAAPGATTPAAITAALSLPEALLLGAGFGLLGALAGELSQRLLYSRAETHLDPPAASIVVTSFVITVLAAVGVFPDPAWIPSL